MTKTLKGTEKTRLELQTEIDARKGAEERNELGQFATPPAMARLIIEAALELLDDEEILFLDPGLGSGSFYSALLAVTNPKKIKSARGVELDRQFASAAKRLWAPFGLDVTRGDFTELRPSPQTQANLLISNPPYVRHHHIEAGRKTELKAQVRAELGIDISGLAGLYCHFMLLAHKWMKPGAVGAWLVPSEFLDVNYGSAVKEYLLKHVDLVRIHRFDPATSQFDDALVSSAVVFFRAVKPSEKPVAFTFGNDLKNPTRSRKIARQELGAESKWSHYLLFRKSALLPDAVPFKDFFQIKRGIATGNNEFFILSEDRVRELEIPRTYLRPVLPSSRYLPRDVIEADAKGDPIGIRRLYLLKCDDPLDIVKERSPSLAAYLKSGIGMGVHATYLCSKRKPWYSQEKREAPLFVCTYMGRSDGESRPFRFILNKSKAIATNVYLLLYPTQKLKTLMERDPKLSERLARHLNQIPAERLIGNGRVYGGGLHKLEPRELGAMPLEPRELGLKALR